MRNVIMLMFLATAWSAAALSYAQRGETRADPFEIARWTIDGGGVMTGTGPREAYFELSGTIGQPDASGASEMTGDPFTLTGGFWFPLDLGDCNSDGGVNLFDHGDLAPCLSGPEGGLKLNCDCFDIDNDNDVDLSDVARFQSAFGGILGD